MEWLVYVHPAAMLAVVALGIAVLREGAELRKARLRRRAPSAARHVRFAKLLIPLVAIGWASGVVSMVLIRNRDMFESIHWPFGTSALILLLIAGAIGLRLERGQGFDQRTAHAAFGAFGVLLMLGAAVAGMSILP